MGSMIAAYKKPTSTAEVAEAVRLFFSEEFGFCAEVRERDESPRVVVQVPESEDDYDILVAPCGSTYVLTDDEMKVIEAMRSGAETWRPNILSGLDEPKDVETLREWLRLALDACTPCLVASAGDDRLDVAFRDGSETSLTLGDPIVASAPDTFWVRGLRASVTDGKPEGTAYLLAEARCMTAAEWSAMGPLPHELGWSAAGLDDGRILAVRLEDELGGEVRGLSVPEDPDTVRAARMLRARLLAALEADERARHVELVVGGDGGGTFRVDYEHDAPSEYLESLQIDLGVNQER